MNPFEMVVAIVFLVTIGSVLRAKYGVGKDRHGNDVRVGDADAARENVELRQELGRLKERLAVLERLATEDNESARLDREIEKLRGHK